MHPKVLATGIICLAIVTSIFIYTKKDWLFASGTPKSTAQVVVDTGAVTIPTSTSDWQKLLNISVATDTAVQIISQKGSTGANENNVTAQLSKNFFALYLQDQKNGVTIDQAEADNIAQQAIAGISVLPNTKQYALTDIQTTANLSPDSKRVYETAMGQTLLNSSLKNNQNELGIIAKATKSQDQNDLDKLDPIISGYQKLVRATLQVTVPTDNAGLHLVYINTLSSILSDIQGLKQVLDDPVEGYVAFALYQRDMVKLGLVGKKMNAYFGR